MYFPLLFQVISRSCFRFAHAAPTIIISTYILRCLLITIHTRGSIQLIHLSALGSLAFAGCFRRRIMKYRS